MAGEHERRAEAMQLLGLRMERCGRCSRTAVVVLVNNRLIGAWQKVCEDCVSQNVDTRVWQTSS